MKTNCSGVGECLQLETFTLQGVGRGRFEKAKTGNPGTGHLPPLPNVVSVGSLKVLRVFF